MANESKTKKEQGWEDRVRKKGKRVKRILLKRSERKRERREGKGEVHRWPHAW